MVSSFKGGEAKRFGNRAHYEDIGNRINIAEAFASNETGKDDVFRNAEVGGEFYQLIFFFAIASKNEDEFGVFMDGEGGGVHKIM